LDSSECIVLRKVEDCAIPFSAAVIAAERSPGSRVR